MRELDGEVYYPIKSISFLTPCGTELNDFQLTVTYPLNFTLSSTNSPIVKIKKLVPSPSEETALGDQNIKNNAQIFTDTLKDNGNYTISSVSFTGVDTFNFTSIQASYCHSPKGCIKSNVEQKILIDKDDNDKTEFTLQYVGRKDNTLKASSLSIRAGETVLSSCDFYNDSNSTAPEYNLIHCSLKETDLNALKGGEDRDKAISYPISFKVTECGPDYITTKITLDVVSGNYISLNRFSLVISLLIFFFIL